MEPWIKLYRKFREWEWYGDVVVMAVFIHLLLSANWKPIKWHGITLDIGEVVIGRRKLAEKLKISEQQVRTALDKLESTQVINRKITNKYTVVKVLNYCNYQGEHESNQQTTSKSTNRATNKKGEENPLVLSVCKRCDVGNQPTEQPTNSHKINQQITTDKEIKNNRNINIEVEEDARVRVREEIAKVINLYEQNIGVPSPITRDVLADLLSSHSADLVELAITEAAKANAHSVNYIEAIFRKWDSLGVTTVSAAMHAIAEHKSNANAPKVVKRAAGATQQKKNFFQDYDENLSDFEVELMKKRVGVSQ